MRNRWINNKINPVVMGVLAALFAMVMLPEKSLCKELAGGRYLNASGSIIEVELEIAEPAPPLVIVIQNLPQGTPVTASSPELMKYDPGTGVAKWLLRGINPGKFLITLQLGRSLNKGEVSGEIRCRDSTGNMVSRKITGS